MWADEIPAATQWHEGMLLAPQHFQQGFWRQEMLSQYGFLLAAPYLWGVRRLSLDTKLLPSGTVRVLDLEAVMPDGTVVAHRPDETHELSIDLAALDAISKQADVTVYVTMPGRSTGAVKGGLSRYEATEGSPVVDENTGEGEIRIPVLRPRLTLMAGEAPPPKYVAIPLVKLRFSNEAWVQTDFITPTMTVALHSVLGDLCAEVAARVREKAMFVSEQVRSPSAVLDMPLMLENRGRMQSLVTGLPQFEALLATGSAHPLTLYLALCAMAGHLSALGTSLLPPLFSPYNHNDPRASFQEVINFAIRMTNEGIPENYVPHPFRLKDRIFSLLFDGEWLNRRLVLGMRTATGMTEKDTIAWGEECLIGSESVLGSLRDRRIRGAGRQFVEKDEELVPVRGVVLFALNTEAEFIRAGEMLRILNFGERGRVNYPLEIVLYVKRS